MSRFVLLNRNSFTSARDHRCGHVLRGLRIDRLPVVRVLPTHASHQGDVRVIRALQDAANARTEVHLMVDSLLRALEKVIQALNKTNCSRATNGDN